MHSSKLEILFNRLENPRMTWNDSYALYGQRQNLSDALFKAKCKVCGEFSESSNEANEAIFNHFAHCSRKHGYIFDENHPIKDFADVDQQLIRSAMLFDLPNPGFENHEGCVKQYYRSKIVCAIHYP